MFSPGDELNPPYIASPLRPTFAVAVAHYFASDIPQASDSRAVLRLGGRYGFLRWHPVGEPTRGIQLDIGGAFVGQFDMAESLDNIGWDGIYSLDLAWANGTGWSANLAFQHDSAHVGDEYAEKTGRTRVGYTREEITLGLRYDHFHPLRVYAETGVQIGGGKSRDPWRVQGGIEYEGERMMASGRAAPYLALNVGAQEEGDWDLISTVQGGLVVRVKRLARVYRLGVEYGKGRSVLGEFHQRDEEYVSVGVWMDL